MIWTNLNRAEAVGRHPVNAGKKAVKGAPSHGLYTHHPDWKNIIASLKHPFSHCSRAEWKMTLPFGADFIIFHSWRPKFLWLETNKASLLLIRAQLTLSCSSELQLRLRVQLCSRRMIRRLEVQCCILITAVARERDPAINHPQRARSLCFQFHKVSTLRWRDSWGALAKTANPSCLLYSTLGNMPVCRISGGEGEGGGKEPYSFISSSTDETLVAVA